MEDMKDWKDSLNKIRKNLNTESKKSLSRNLSESTSQSNKCVVDNSIKPNLVDLKTVDKNQKFSSVVVSSTPIVAKDRTKNSTILSSSNLEKKNNKVGYCWHPIPSTLSPVKRVSSVNDRFRLPESWVQFNIAQLHQKSASLIRKSMDVVIGLDFGTSYTKVAVGFKDVVVPVNWSGVSKNPEKYLLPSEFSELKDNTLVLGIDPAIDPVGYHQYLKQPFLQNNVPIKSCAVAACFLAMVLRYVFAWLYKEYSSLFAGYHVRWALNLGAPSNGLEISKIENTYTKLATIAWQLAVGGEQIKIANAEQLFCNQSFEKLPLGLFDKPSIIPELVAQLAAYVQSPSRKQGLHTLVDIGGGTLDVVTFNVHRRDGDDFYPFFVSKVVTLGTQMVNLNRLVGYEKNYDKARLPDELSDLLDYRDFSSRVGIDLEYVKLRDKILFDEVKGVVKAVLHRTKVRRYKNAPEWKDGLRVFLTGGGAFVKNYREAVEVGIKSVAPGIFMPLPKHSKVTNYLENISSYQRISVACGLAFDKFTLGQILPATMVSDDPALSSQKIYAQRPDRDDLYPH